MVEYKIGEYGELVLSFFYQKPRRLLIPRNVPVILGINRVAPRMREWLLRNVDVYQIEAHRLLSCYENGTMGDVEVRDKMRKWLLE